jgi:hypothetical protein
MPPVAPLGAPDCVSLRNGAHDGSYAESGYYLPTYKERQTMALDLRRTSSDWLVCTCGNQPHIDGFYPCLPDGTIIEPDIDGEWNGLLYVCQGCNAIYDIDTYEQVGTAGN